MEALNPVTAAMTVGRRLTPGSQCPRWVRVAGGIAAWYLAATAGVLVLTAALAVYGLYVMLLMLLTIVWPFYWRPSARRERAARRRHRELIGVLREPLPRKQV